MPADLAGWLVALGLVAALIPTAAVQRRRAAAGVFALMLLYLTALWIAGALIASRWSALAPLIAAIAVWLAIQPLLALGRVPAAHGAEGPLTCAELGLVAPRPGSVRPAIVATVLLLAVNALVIGARGPTLFAPWALLPLVIIAAVVEELVMRGVLLALVDRAHPPRWNVAGARIGVGGLVLTLAFVALHGLRPGLLLGVAPAALLYLWLRARSGSLLPPIAAHAAWNATVVLLHR